MVNDNPPPRTRRRVRKPLARYAGGKRSVLGGYSDGFSRRHRGLLRNGRPTKPRRRKRLGNLVLLAAQHHPAQTEHSSQITSMHTPASYSFPLAAIRNAQTRCVATPPPPGPYLSTLPF